MNLDLLRDAMLAPFGSVEDFFALGGWVLKVILLAAAVMWTLILERGWYFARIHRHALEQRQIEWMARTDRHSWTAHRIREQLISQVKLGMEASLPLIRVMVPLAPLLGLFGTVTGMLEVFDAMTAAGQADVRAMAFGVSHAMIATLSGLVVSLNGLYFAVLLSSRVRRESQRLPDAFALN